jgi:periplasmic protein TonB
VNFKSAVNDRKLWRSLAISLALHAWLLSQTLPQSALPGAAQPLAATLRPPSREPVKGIVEPVASLPVPPVPTPPTAHAAAPVAVMAAPAAFSSPGETARPPQALRTAPRANSVTSASAAAAATEQGKTEIGAGLDADGMHQYRVSLAAAARRFKRYPAQALARGWSGSAQVEVSIAAGGMPQPPRLMASSGHELLDEAALSMIGSAAQATIVPANLRGRAFAVRLPVVFDLEEE